VSRKSMRPALAVRAPLLAGLTVLLGLPPGLVGQSSQAASIPDTLPTGDREIRNASSAQQGLRSGDDVGVWVWDRAAILASPALTFPDLLGEIPGLVLVRGGDLGAPVGISAFAQGAGQVRIFLDGIEERSVESSAMDLAGISMIGLEEVRVERGVSEVRIYLRTHQAGDPRPSTHLDVSTGDLRTNLFRVGFVHPSVAGGSLLVALDRADTDGPGQGDRGALYGTRFQYALFPRQDLSVAVDVRSRTARRPANGNYLPGEVNRSDLRVRVGWEPIPNFQAQLHVSRLRASGVATGAAADTLLIGEAMRSAGANVLWRQGPLRIWGAGAVQESLGWPESQLEGGAEIRLPRIGGLAIRFDQEAWADESKLGRAADGEPILDLDDIRKLRATGGWAITGWTGSFLGMSLFGEADRASRGVPFVVGPDIEIPPSDGEDTAEVSFQPRGFAPLQVPGRDGVRVGAQLNLSGLDLTGAWFRVQAERLPPLGLPLDRSGLSRDGGERAGFEVMGRMSLSPLLQGLSLAGSGSFWNVAGTESAITWAYLPERAWAGRLTWYRAGYEGRFESWVDVGVRGRDAMLTSLPNPSGAPPEVGFSQNWYTRFQVRVATVRVFLHWDNLAFRDENADIPERFLPKNRAMYGIRWTMWN
jgi:hypothetical protein